MKESVMIFRTFTFRAINDSQDWAQSVPLTARLACMSESFARPELTGPQTNLLQTKYGDARDNRNTCATPAATLDSATRPQSIVFSEACPGKKKNRAFKKEKKSERRGFMKRKPQQAGRGGEAPVPSSQISTLTSNLQPPHLASFTGGYNAGYSHPVHQGMHPAGAAADDRMRALTAQAHAIAQHQQHIAAALAHNAAGGYTAAVQFNPLSPAGAGGNTSRVSLVIFMPLKFKN
jgi:hypothetical protein